MPAGLGAAKDRGRCAAKRKQREKNGSEDPPLQKTEKAESELRKGKRTHLKMRRYNNKR